MELLSQEEKDELIKLGVALDNAVKARDWLEACRLARNEAICALRLRGWTINDCAELTGLSVSAVVLIGEQGGIVKHRKVKAK